VCAGVRERFGLLFPAGAKDGRSQLGSTTSGLASQRHIEDRHLSCCPVPHAIIAPTQSVRGTTNHGLRLPSNGKAQIFQSTADGPRWREPGYTSQESGRPNLHVVPFRGAQGTNGGYQPQCSRDGREFYYFNQASRTVFAVPVKEVNGALEFGTAQAVASKAMSKRWASMPFHPTTNEFFSIKSSSQ